MIPSALLLARVLAASAPAVAPQAERAVPVEEEPAHKTVFKNDYVQVFRVTLPPRESTLMHTHARADAAVRLAHATVRHQSPDGSLGSPEALSPGSVSARENEGKPHTHRVHNVGATTFDVLDVQVLSRPAGPAAPALFEPAAENSRMRVYRYELGPNGGASAVHSHTRPYLLVAATDVDLRMTSPDGAAMDHPVKAGDLHWVDSRVTHTLVNRGATKGVLVEFELK